jgi:hypothetical protein
VDGLSLRRTNSAAGSKELLHWAIPRSSLSLLWSLTPPPLPRRKQAPSYDTPPKYRSKITIVDEEDGAADETAFLHKGYHWSDGKKAQYAGLHPPPPPSL